MLPRLAACFVSLGLLASSAGAETAFSRPPEVTMPSPEILPVRTVAPAKADVIKALKARRAKNLASFRAYRKGGIYPHNTYRLGPLNVWRDRDGHLCAAATMIDKDGKHDLVIATANTNNQIRLLDVTEGPLLDWMLTSGFTIEEIDRIQMPMVEPEPPVDFTRQDQILAAGYLKTDKALVKNEKASLQIAANRLLHSPELAWKLVEGTI